MFELVEQLAPNAVIKVIGVGGGGGNAVEHMVNSSIEGVEFVCANTDAQALKSSGARTTLQLGDIMAEQVEGQVERTEGVGGLNSFGTGYAMRIWLDPLSLVRYQLTPSDVVAAVQAQNTTVSCSGFSSFRRSRSCPSGICFAPGREKVISSASSRTSSSTAPEWVSATSQSEKAIRPERTFSATNPAMFTGSFAEE